MSWRVVFYGREAGAIGALSWWDITVEAPSIDAARLKLYETHEHIRIESIERVD